MKKYTHQSTPAETIARTFVHSAESLSNQVDSYVAPVRKSAFERFPILFLLLVTFGVTAISFSFEQILSQYEILNKYPWFILGIGISTLSLTGRLYKKLK